MLHAKTFDTNSSVELHVIRITYKDDNNANRLNVNDEKTSALLMLVDSICIKQLSHRKSPSNM